MNRDELNKMLQKHRQWLTGDSGGENLSWVDLSGANLSGANLSEANLSWVDLSWVDLSEANLSGVDLSLANLSEANLSEANLSKANLSKANLSEANLSEANLSKANLSEANLSKANLSLANLSGANLSLANLSGVDLSGADLSGAIGLQNPIDWLEQHFEFSADGLIAYKVFSLHYSVPNTWEIEPESIIEEVCNPIPTTNCSSGINVATMDWIKSNSNTRRVWRCLIRWPWLAGVVVPYSTDGKIRAARVELIEEIEI